jgi:hypothetical protein
MVSLNLLPIEMQEAGNGSNFLKVDPDAVTEELVTRGLVLNA